MKVVHGVGWYLPESVGGSEVYVQSLCAQLQQRGVESVVMAPRDGSEQDEYMHDGVRVIRYPVPRAWDSDQLAGRTPHALFEIFQGRLQEQRADIFHLHSLTAGSGVHHLACASRLGMRTLMTAHVPGVVCARGTMLRFGREVCDGRIDPTQCVPCWLTSMRMPEALALPAGSLLRHLPAALGDRAPGAIGTALRAPQRIAASRRLLLDLAERCDLVVAVCEWLRNALLANGVPAGKVRFCRQGVRSVLPAGARGPVSRCGAPSTLRVGYFGRMAHVKGADVLVAAVCGLPAATRIELRMYAPPSREDERGYAAAVHAAAAGDARVQFRGALPNADVQAAMRECDVVAVPSRWLETGPLVAMEALAAGIPVIGSDRGGLAEMIEPGVNGWLVPADDARAWAAQLERLASEGARLEWDPATTNVITTAEVAARMHALYVEVCS